MLHICRKSVKLYLRGQANDKSIFKEGEEAMKRLAGAKVAVFGIGGVGGYVCEALVRSGVGAFDLIDDDKICLTNLNRQNIATRKTVGKYKADVMKDRILEINWAFSKSVNRI